MKILGIVGYSGSGKTRLVTRLIPLLRAEGLSVSTIKHTHHSVRVDAPDAVSRTMTMAGATEVAVVGVERWALLHEHRDGPEPAVEDLAEAMAPVDLLLVEGFKRHPYPKIEVHRPAVGKPLICADDPYVIAVATDGPLPVTDLPVLDLNDPAAIVEFILRQIRALAVDDAATGYRIRPARPEDASRLPEIERDGAEAFRAFGMTAVAELPPATAEQYRSTIEAGRVWVARDGSGEIVGFAEVSLVDGRPHLAEIDVLRAHARRGVGRRLVAAVAAWARNAGYAELTLTTFRDVPMNGPFYARLGFVPLRPGPDRPELAAIRDAEHRSGVETSPRIAMRLVL